MTIFGPGQKIFVFHRCVVVLVFVHVKVERTIFRQRRDIEMSEVGVGKHGQILIQLEFFGRKMLLFIGRQSIQVIEVLREIWPCSATITRHYPFNPHQFNFAVQLFLDRRTRGFSRAAGWFEGRKSRRTKSGFGHFKWYISTFLALVRLMWSPARAQASRLSKRMYLDPDSLGSQGR